MNRRSVLEFSPGAAGPLLASVDDLSWQDRALCAETDPEIFYPEKGGSVREPKRVCFACEVRAECLEYALENEEPHGIWGGLSPEERRGLLRHRLEARKAAWIDLRAELDERARQQHPDGIKRCSHCKNTKPVGAFGYVSRAADGLSYQCLDCRALERETLKEAA